MGLHYVRGTRHVRTRSRNKKVKRESRREGPGVKRRGFGKKDEGTHLRVNFNNHPSLAVTYLRKGGQWGGRTPKDRGEKGKGYFL